MTTLCLIHGWASNARIFDRLRRRLPEDWQIIAPNLAGHGDASPIATFSIAAAAEHIAATLPDNSNIFGWSLGGLVAQYIALNHPQKVRRLILCSTFAKLLACEGYPEGIHSRTLDKMLHLFQHDYTKYIRRFLAQQLRGSEHTEEILQAVLPDVIKDGTPKGIASTLDAVAQADTRFRLPEIACLALLIYGGKDEVTPPRMGQYLARHIAHAQLEILPNAAHTPFLSHADKVAEMVKRFVQAA